MAAPHRTRSFDHDDSENRAVVVEAEAEKPKKLSFKELREFEAIEKRIAEAEARLPEIDHEMAVSAADAGRVNELFTEQQQLNQQLETDMERWAELAERHDG